MIFSRKLKEETRLSFMFKMWKSIFLSSDKNLRAMNRNLKENKNDNTFSSKQGEDEISKNLIGDKENYENYWDKMNW